MKPPTALVLALLVLPLRLAAQTPAQRAQEIVPAAVPAVIAGEVMEAMGGKAAWAATHYLRFTFDGRRTHYWDKRSGRHRLEGTNRQGEKYVVLDNVDTHWGRAFVDGKEVDSSALQQWLDNSYGAWVNDSQWLLMPYKLQDPGVSLAAAGLEEADGQVYDKLLLSIGAAGRGPGDQYWAWINRNTHLMDRWAYLPQDHPRDAAPTSWRWLGWRRYGKILLAPTRIQIGSEKKLELSDIAVDDTLPDAVFTAPGPVTVP